MDSCPRRRATWMRYDDRSGDLLPCCAHPSHYHLIEAFPLTSNGKVDKRALRELVQQEKSESRPVVVAMPQPALPVIEKNQVTISYMEYLEKHPRMSSLPSSGTNKTISFDLKSEFQGTTFRLGKGDPRQEAAQISAES